MRANADRRRCYRGPSKLDFLMLAFSLSAIAWIVLYH